VEEDRSMTGVALGVQTPQINGVANYLGARQAAREDVSTQINQAGARQAQEAAALEQIAQMGLGVMGGKVDGQVDPVAFEEMLGLLGENPLAAKLRNNPELLPVITRGSMTVLQAAQNAEEFEFRKKQFELELQKFEEGLKPGLPEAPKVETRFNDDTGRDEKVQWNPATGAWEPFGGQKAGEAGGAPTIQTIFDPETGRDRKIQWNADKRIWEDIGGIEAPSDANGVTITNPDGTTTQIGGKGSGAYDMAEGRGLYDLGKTIAAEGRSGSAAVSRLAKMKELLENEKVYTGIGAEQVQALQRFGALFGVTEGIEDLETFNSLSKQAALDLMGGSLGTGFSNADRDFVEGQVPQMQNTKQGNLALIDVLTQLAERKKDIAKFATDYKRDHGGKIDWEFDGALAEWADANPLFGDAAPALPTIGDIVEGHEYVGGDPALETSWKKV
jgi:hypothetical protein